jgi:signal transduction histidine kinase/DNA-binding response OmpR family regulator
LASIPLEYRMITTIRYILFFIFALFICVPTNAQTYSVEECIELLDSLYYVEYPDDLTDLRESTFFHLSQDYPDTTLARLTEYWAFVYEGGFKYDSALVYYEKATQYYLNLHDSIQVAHMLYGQAGCYTELQEHVTSTNKYLEAINLYEAVGTEGDLADTYNAMASNFYYAGDEHIAISYYKKAISYYEKVKDIEQLAMIYGNMASTFDMLESYDSALYYFKKALSQVSGTDYTNLIIGIYHGIGIVKENTKDYKSAYYYYRRALDLAKKQNKVDLLGFSYQYLGYYHLSQKRYDSALYYALTANEVSKDFDIYLLQYNSFDLLHRTYSKMGRYEKAYEYLELLKQHDDSLFTLNKARQISFLSKQFDEEKKEKELLAQNLEIEKYKSNLKAEQNVKSLLIVGLMAMFAIVILIFRNERMKAKVNRLLQKKNEEVLAKNKQIQKIEEAKTKWFVNVSHELRTPLSLVKGPVQQVVRNSQLDEANASLLEIAGRNIHNLEKLVDEILDLSKLESGEVKLEIEVFDSIAWIKEILLQYKEVVNERSINLTFDSLVGDYFFIKLDIEKFSKVINNLISNSLKFTEDGGTIALTIDEVEEGFRILLADSGVGIPKSDLPFIFDRFYQASNASMIHDHGTGVGLSLSKEIVELHSGYIEARSQQNQGSQFIITLPKSVIAKEEEYVVPQKTPIAKKYLEQTIVVIEDNPDMQEFVKSFLNVRYDVVKCMNAQDAWHTIEENRPNLIITDLMMPVMDGEVFIKKLKDQKEYRDIPIIVITAIADEQKRLRLLRMGVDDYLVKPFNPEELLIKVDNLVSINRSSRSSDEEEDIEELSFEDRLVKELEANVKENISDPEFNVTKLAEAASLSERQLYRYLNQMTKMTPANFIKEIRLQRAFELARRNVYATTSELSYAVGFQHPSYFTTVFKKRFGKRPSDYMKEKLS